MAAVSVKRSITRQCTDHYRQSHAVSLFLSQNNLRHLNSSFRVWSRIPVPFSRKSRIPNFCHLYPEYPFFFPNNASRVKRLASPASRSSSSQPRQIQYPVFEYSRIPQSISVKSRVPRIPFRPWSFALPALSWQQAAYLNGSFSLIFSLIWRACSLNSRAFVGVPFLAIQRAILL